MSAKFEGILSPGEAVMVHCGGVWLQGLTIGSFTAAPGAPASLRLHLTAVLAGSFPAVNTVDELTVNANSWDIYRANDAEVKPLVPRHSGQYDEIIEGLQIFAQYQEGFLHAEHDEVFAGPDEEAITPAHATRLRELNWHAYDQGTFSHFV
jgi:hypothetical protein